MYGFLPKNPDRKVKATELDLAVLKRIQIAGGVIIESDFNAYLIGSGVKVPKSRIQRLIQLNMLSFNNDGLFDGFPQTIIPKEENSKEKGTGS